MRFEWKLLFNVLVLVLGIVFAIVLVVALTQQYVSIFIISSELDKCLNEQESVLVVNLHHLQVWTLDT